MNAASSPFSLKPNHTPSSAEYPTHVFLSASQWAPTIHSRSALNQPATKFYWVSFLKFSHAQGSHPHLSGLLQRQVGSSSLMPPGKPCSHASFLLWLWFPCLESCSLWSILQWQWDDLFGSLTILFIHDFTWPKEKTICSLSCTQSSAFSVHSPPAACHTYSLAARHKVSYLDALTHAVPRAWDIFFPLLGEQRCTDNFNLFMKIWTKWSLHWMVFSVSNSTQGSPLSWLTSQNATIFLFSIYPSSSELLKNIGTIFCPLFLSS